MIGGTNSKSLIEPFEPSIFTWSGGTYTQISRMLDYHYKGVIDISDYWAVGDVRTEHLSAMTKTTYGAAQPEQDIELVIIGIKHDDLTTPINGISKAAITVQTKSCLTNASWYDNDDELWSYDSSYIYTYVNNIKKAFSTELTSLIKQVTKKTNRGCDKDYDDGWFDDSGEWIDWYILCSQSSSDEYLFLLSGIEYRGGTTGKDIGIVFDSLSIDGNQYEYMTISGNRLKPLNGSADNISHFTRNIGVDSYGKTQVVAMSTSATIFDAVSPIESNVYGVAPAFCL